LPCRPCPKEICEKSGFSGLWVFQTVELTALLVNIKVNFFNSVLNAIKLKTALYTVPRVRKMCTGALVFSSAFSCTLASMLSFFVAPVSFYNARVRMEDDVGLSLRYNKRIQNYKYPINSHLLYLIYSCAFCSPHMEYEGNIGLETGKMKIFDCRFSHFSTFYG
jgi:hypothetical protein